MRYIRGGGGDGAVVGEADTAVLLGRHVGIDYTSYGQVGTSVAPTAPHTAISACCAGAPFRCCWVATRHKITHTAVVTLLCV